MALRLKIRKYERFSDEELLDEYLKGLSLEILGLLYHRYMHMVYGVCLKYFKERNASQDAVMAIFEKLIIELGKHTVSNFKSWLYVLTRNFCLMELRTRNKERDRIRYLNDDENLFMENQVDLHPIDKGGKNIDEALDYCIEKLKDEQKACIRLFYYEDKCYTEIAALLRMDENKVKSHLQNGKRNLKICLEKRNVEE